MHFSDDLNAYFVCLHTDVRACAAARETRCTDADSNKVIVGYATGTNNKGEAAHGTCTYTTNTVVCSADSNACTQVGYLLCHVPCMPAIASNRPTTRREAHDCHVRTLLPLSK